MPLISTRGAASAQGFGEFAQSAGPVYIEDVFSTYLYTGNGSTQTITNGIDLSGKGGLVWMKGRSGATNHALYDTVRGATKDLASNTATAETTEATGLTAFSGTGFSIGALAKLNTNAATYASWTFRKQAKFFDIVTWTGNGSNRTISHNLGSVPGCIIVKRTDTTGNWAVYHRSLANTEWLVLNDTTGKLTDTTLWNSTTATSANFSLGTSSEVNANGGTYVAYIFAHNAGGFGLSGTDNVISCGSFTTDGSGDATVTLGYEPQLAMVKISSGTGDWLLKDNMRGTPVGTAGPVLYPNLSSAEANFQTFSPNATGFTISGLGGSSTYIYIAIRRGPMKVPTSGTSVFVPIARAGTSATANISTGFVTDATIIKNIAGGFAGEIFDRLRGANKRMYPDQVSAESTTTDHLTSFATNDGYTLGASASGEVNLSGYNYANWNFRRAPGFFDVVCYTGTGVATTQAHNLAAVPELMIVKRRNATGNEWTVYTSNGGISKLLFLNLTDGYLNDSNLWVATPTSTVFSLPGTAPTYDVYLNTSGGTYVAYLFATLAGVSKVGSYTGSGTTKQIDCGFTAGARFVLIKRTDSTGSWYVYDSARGIVAGNDPYLFLDRTDAEVTSTDYVDTYSAGFELSSTAPAGLNANGGTYIFLAIA